MDTFERMAEGFREGAKEGQHASHALGHVLGHAVGALGGPHGAVARGAIQVGALVVCPLVGGTVGALAGLFGRRS